MRNGTQILNLLLFVSLLLLVAIPALGQGEITKGSHPAMVQTVEDVTPTVETQVTFDAETVFLAFVVLAVVLITVFGALIYKAVDKLADSVPPLGLKAIQESVQWLIDRATEYAEITVTPIDDEAVLVLNDFWETIKDRWATEGRLNVELLRDPDGKLVVSEVVKAE